MSQLSETPVSGIGHLLEPRSVAVIGASEDQGKFGGRVLYMLLRHKFAGTVYPINPNRETLLGVKAYKSLLDTPDAPDMAIMAVPRSHVKARVEECVARGVRCAIVITASFGDAGPEGAALEREIVAIARAGGMRLIGPNCLGVISPANALVLCSSPALDIDTLPRGPIGFITQSGALMGTVFDRATAMGIGFSHCVSVGNQADLELCDFVEMLIDDSRTQVICTYIEGVKSPARLVELARRARAAGKPWLAVKAGQTEAGGRAAFSHTASLAGDYAALEAVCRAENVVLLDDVFAMLLLAAAMARHPGYRPDGIAVFSTSGGSAALTVDRLTESGIPLAQLSAAGRSRMGQVFAPGHGHNPIDYYGPKSGDAADFGYQATRLALADEAATLALVVITTAPDLTGLAREVIRAADEAGKPAIHVIQAARLGDGSRGVLREAGQPFTDSITEAVDALRGWRDWVTYTEPAPPAPVARIAVELPAGACELGEDEAKALLRAAGVPVNDGVVVADARQARAHAAAVGFPMAVKVVSPQLVHKTEVGGVALGIADEVELESAITQMRSRVAAARPDAMIEGFLLQRMVAGDVELLVGARRDPQFGPLVVVGSGGVLVELLKDVVTLPAPVSRSAVLAALRSLRIAPLLDGYRGKPPVDMDAVVDAIVRLGDLAASLGGRDFEIEVNPLKAGPSGCVAVDARARFGPEMGSG